MSGEPLFFQGRRGALFGWLHRAAGSGASGRGLILCPPLGHEAINSHRSYRFLANAAANAGINTLRFDYYATGDSAGHDRDPDLVPTWIEDIRTAAAVLESRCPVNELCLFGMRFGALLAQLALQDMQIATALIAFNPVTSGRRLLREVTALAATGETPVDDATSKTPGLFEAGGFALSDGTRAAIQSLEWPAVQHNRLRDVLLMDRVDLPLCAELAFGSVHGTPQVTRRTFEGYADMMLDPHESVLPEKALRTCIAWLGSLQPVTARNPANGTAPTGAPDSSGSNGDASADIWHPVAHAISQGAQQLRESIVWLDKAQRVFALVTEPVTGARAQHKGREVLLLPNAGAVHHVGPGRLYVKLARDCAAAGVTTVRLDLAGLGDSGVHAGQQRDAVYSAHALTDLHAATQALRRRWPEAQLHCAGICSGAYHGFAFARQSTLLRSVIIINPLTFFPILTHYYLNLGHRVVGEVIRERRSMQRPSTWVRLLRGGVDFRSLATFLIARGLAHFGRLCRRAFRAVGIPLANDLANSLTLIAKRGTFMHFVFASSHPGFRMLQEVGSDTLAELERQHLLMIDIVSPADHTFTQRRWQEALSQLLVTHFRRQDRQHVTFPAPEYP